MDLDDLDPLDALEALVDTSLQSLPDAISDESFTLCRVCDEVDGHTDDCPVRAAVRWLRHV